MEPKVQEREPIHVLVVEDEFFICELVAQVLSQNGFSVRTAMNAADALHSLAAEPVDVLFTDINLPGSMDGAALARRARQLQPNLQVVYASARASMLEPEARVPGAIIVTKPYEPALVGRLLAAAMNSAVSGTPA
jgi:CheY-like chemotaxis protein